MPENNQPLSFLRSRPARLLSVLLLLQALVLYGFSRRETLPDVKALSAFPSQFAGWTLVQEGVIDQETAAVLRADDLLNRTYSGSGVPVNLFVAFFKTQRTGQAPHSPKNCLPGSGWVPELSEIVSLSVPGRAQPIPVNRYVVQKGDEKSVVMYWYQSRDRVVASEYEAKFFVVADAIRYNRTDTALVRIVVPAVGGRTADAADAAARFARDSFPLLTQILPQ